MIHVEEKDLKIILDILQKYPYTFYAFGSRVTGKHQPFSDLDLCYIEPIPLAVLGNIREDFEKSNLPFTVDLIEYPTTAQDFQAHIKHSLLKISP